VAGTGIHRHRHPRGRCTGGRWQWQPPVAAAWPTGKWQVGGCITALGRTQGQTVSPHTRTVVAPPSGAGDRRIHVVVVLLDPGIGASLLLLH